MKPRAGRSRAPAKGSSSMTSVARMSALLAAGDDALDHFGRHVEGGRAFGGVEHAQASAGAGADIKEPAAAFKAS